jgi:hypothetical protein
MTRAALVVVIALTVGGSGGDLGATPPDDAPLTWTAAGLAERYADSRHRLTVAAAAARHAGDTRRADHLAAMGRPDRQFLRVSLTGDGQAVEVLGDLLTARRVAVVVPGSDSNLDTFDHLGTDSGSVGGAARALRAELLRLDPRSRVAVVAWLGYPAPRTKSAAVLTPGRAEAGGTALARLLAEIHRTNQRASMALVCHSYGTVVCAYTLHGVDRTIAAVVSAVVLVGSPGVGFRSVRDIGTTVPVWVGRGGADWIARVPHVRLDVLGVSVGFGADPMSVRFGGRRFAAGDGGHSDYFVPGSVALQAIALIVRGPSA